MFASAIVSYVRIQRNYSYYTYGRNGEMISDDGIFVFKNNKWYSCAPENDYMQIPVNGGLPFKFKQHVPNWVDMTRKHKWERKK